MLRRVTFLLFSLLFLGLPAWVQTARAQSTQDFIIKSFTADYYLTRQPDKSPSMIVNETIVALFPDYDQNHGILRALPERYKGHSLSLKINSLTDGLKAWHYTTSRQNDNLVLKVGDADRYVHGEQHYIINYSLRNVIDIEHQELYWNINGLQWPQAISSVVGRFHIPSDLTDDLLPKQVCYTGSLHSRSSDCTINRYKESGGQVIDFETTDGLGSYQNMTAVMGFKPGTFQLGPEVAHEQAVHRAKVIAAWAMVLAPPLVAFSLMYRRWRQFGNDPKGRGVIIPEYEPPQGFNVLASQFMRNYTVDQRAFSAAIIQLAVQRYLTIYETKQKKALRKDTTDYELEIIKDPSDLPEEMQKVINILFDDDASVGNRIKLSEFRKNHSNIYSDIGDLRDKLSKKLVGEGYFQKDPSTVRNVYFGVGAGLIFVPIGFVFIMPLAFIALGVLLSGLVVLVFAFIMPARTESGVQIHDDLLGLRDYIKLAEADRLKYLQSPEGAEKISKPSKFNPKTKVAKVKLFEKLLPYAMLFGLENQWAKQFKDIYKTAPDWYQGNIGTFNAVYLGSQLSSFNAASSVSFSSPSSSSGSGFSSGGGFSGGGGGGGGGGGW